MPAVRLLDALSPLHDVLDGPARKHAADIWLRIRNLAPGAFDARALLRDADAFDAVLLDGMILGEIRVGEQVGLRLLGPGDLVFTGRPRSELITYERTRVAAPTRLALFGEDLLAGLDVSPGLIRALHLSTAEQNARILAQLVICQLPRVEDRLLAIMWLLAETWGHVTSAGVVLPLSLTHDVLGGLVGARRSTVTVAVGQLVDQGMVLRQDGGWLLLDRPGARSGPIPDVEVPTFLREPPAFTGGEAGPRPHGSELRHLVETVRRLRAEHVHTRDQMRAQLERLELARARRAEIHPRAGRLTPPAAPS